MSRQIDLSVCNLVKQFGDFTAVDDISFDVAQGSFFSILGPSGCGKTTLLRMIAGFEEPTHGSLRIRGMEMRGIPPNRRPVNLVFQHLALFPMMTVSENIAFGLRRRGEKAAEIARKTASILERVELPEYADQQIHQLSGGQKQRVAIARCLVLEPLVLLLDEPLGALDLKLREQMKVELKKLQAQVGTTFIYITHDQSEALVMSDTVAVMNRGRFEQIATPQQLYHDPVTPFVAGFVGDNNRFEGRVTAVEQGVAAIEVVEGQRFRCRMWGELAVGERAGLYIRPEAMLINPEPDRDLNTFRARVKTILFDGGNSRLLVTLGETTHELLVSLPQNRQYDHIVAGDLLTIGWDAQAGLCFAAQETP